MNVQRFRSTTSKPEVSEPTPSTQEPIAQSVPTEAAKSAESPQAVTSTPSTTTLPPTTVPASPSSVSVDPGTEKIPSPGLETSSTTEAGSTTETVRLVEDSVTEILLTTAPASASSSPEASAKSSTAAVSQPRPFSFSRRGRPSTEATTTPLPASGDPARSKVSIASRNHTRTSFLVGRGRVRPRNEPSPETERVDRVDGRNAAEEPSRSPGRSRQRGSSRYTPPSFRLRAEEQPKPSRERARTTEAPTAEAPSTPEPVRRRFRRPSSRASSQLARPNELEDSPIIRISQSQLRRASPRSRSAAQEEDEKITNIKVFSKPAAVNRDIYARTRYTRKRNNGSGESKETDGVSAVSDPVVAASTISSLETSEQTIASTPFRVSVTEEPLLNSVEEEDGATTEGSQATADLDVTTTGDEISTTESSLENEVVTVTPDSRFVSEGPNQVTTTMGGVELQEFDPDVIRIAFNSSTVDPSTQESRNDAVPRRRKILLRKRPVASTAVSQEEEEDRTLLRRRKVIRRLRPVRNNGTESTVEVSSTEDLNLLPSRSTTTEIYESRDESGAVTEELSAEAKDISDVTETLDKSTVEALTIGGVDFRGATLETPTAETAIHTENSDPDAVTMASTIIDNFTVAASESPAREESVTETSGSETTSFFVNFTDNILDETTPDQPETPPTTVSTTPLAVQSTRRLEPYNRTYHLDSRYVRKKFVRRRPVESEDLGSSAKNVTARYPASRTVIRLSSTTENSNLEGLSKRRKALFVRRRPVSSTTQSVEEDSAEKGSTGKDSVDEDGEELEDEKTLAPEKQSDPEDSTLRVNRVNDPTVPDIDSAKSDSAEFWNRYTTASASASNQNLFPITDTTFEEYFTTTSNRRPDGRPRHRVPDTPKKTVSTEYPPDSSPEESEESRDFKSKYRNFRQPRTRYRLRDGSREQEGAEESVPDATQSPSFESSTQVRSRFYVKRPVSTTESPVTETLIPARKFDYVADAHRRQQSLRTSPRNQNEESTTLRSPSEENQNLVDADYTTTPPPKPLVTRLVTSVEESATTERQRILIKTKYSSLTSTTRIPLQTTVSRAGNSVTPVPEFPARPKDSRVRGHKDRSEDESANEIRQGHVERSTLPIEGEFLQRAASRFTTESHESSTIEIESVFSNLIGSRDLGQ